jgi:hypothetical protein
VRLRFTLTVVAVEKPLARWLRWQGKQSKAAFGLRSVGGGGGQSLRNIAQLQPTSGYIFHAH